MSLGPGRGSDSTIRVRLQELKNKLCCLIDNTAQIDLNLQPQQRIPYIERVTGPWTNPANTFSFSVANVGNGNGTVQTATIKPGEIVNFDASSLNNYFPIESIEADGTGTELLISWIIQA
jgi:hypothetical protein